MNYYMTLRSRIDDQGCADLPEPGCHVDVVNGVHVFGHAGLDVPYLLV